jgi:enoyl-CoA hydratase/3-hydroxyacyl-CoA dehydrogenase
MTEELAKKFNPIQLLGNILNNAAWLVTNQASDIAEIEKALSLGMGLKKPLFDTAKQFGIQNIVDELDKLSKENKFYEPDPYLISIK